MRCEMFLGSIDQVEPQYLADVLIGDLDHDCIEIAA